MAGMVENKVVVVTGGALGIGRAAAQAFSREGGRIVVADIRDDEGAETVRLVKDNGGKAVFVHCDVTQSAGVQALVEQTVAIYGRLDCAFNNAGFEGDFAPTAECSEENFDRAIAINLKGVWLCMRAEIGQMVRQKSGGAIVNTASVAGVVAERGYPAYAAAKGGVIQLSRTAAVEYANAGIRVNVICPGMINTPMVDRAQQAMSMHGYNPGLPENSVSFWIGERIIRWRPAREMMLKFLTPMARLGKPEEIAEAAVFLCSDRAAYMTGQTMTIDGGMTAA
jgi:NAD(P)-dependent dehydrogenase (short-subunit alcohol dehydrogenase family)